MTDTLPHKNAKIAALYAQGLVDYLRTRDIDAATLLPSADFESNDGTNHQGETSLAQWIQLLDTASEVLNEPELPAVAGANLQPRHLGALGHVLMSCTDLQDAYTQLSRYIRLLGQIGQPELVVSDSTAHLIWHWPYPTPAPQSVALFMLAARVRFMRWLTDHHELKVDARFAGAAPGPLEDFERIFGGNIRFGCDDNELIFPASFLSLKIVTADVEFLRQAQERAQSLLQGLDEEPRLIRQIKRVLMSRLASGRLAIDDTAAALHMSSRTLQRRLKQQQMKYQTVLDQVRAECVASLIRDPAIPLAEIAFLLGYQDQSTFQTAYKRWFETSPGKARQELIGSGA